MQIQGLPSVHPFYSTSNSSDVWGCLSLRSSQGGDNRREINIIFGFS